MPSHRMTGVMRLIKVVRLIRATRLYKRWKSSISLSYGMETLLKCLTGTLLAGHWTACIIGLEASLHSFASETWLGPDLYGKVRKSGSAVALSVEVPHTTRS